MANEIWSPQGWNLSFRRHLNDWSMRVVGILQDLNSFKGTNMKADLVRWKHNSYGSFQLTGYTVAKCRKYQGE